VLIHELKSVQNLIFRTQKNLNTIYAPPRPYYAGP